MHHQAQFMEILKNIHINFSGRPKIFALSKNLMKN